MARYVENALTCIGEKMPRLPPRRIKTVQIRISILVHRVLVSNPVFSISSPGIQKSSPGFLKDESGFFPSPGFPSPRPIVPIKIILTLHDMGNSLLHLLAVAVAVIMINYSQCRWHAEDAY